MKNQVGCRTSRQHASREDNISHTIRSEMEEFEACGIGQSISACFSLDSTNVLSFLEIPDLGCSKNVEYLKEWNGELRFIQNIQLKRYRKRDLQPSDTVPESSSAIVEMNCEMK